MNATPLIEVRGFRKLFGTKVVHDGVDFTLHAGEVVSLIGGSGSGKSVLLRSLIGLEKPDAGTLKFKGKDITHLNEHEWNEVRTKIAYVFQGGALFDSLTVEENLLYPLDAHTTLTRAQKMVKVNETLDLLGLKNANELLPADLSGGMQKRAGLARALMLDPEVILYDEPTAGLDPFNTKNIQDIIVDLKNKGRGGILVTHDMPTAFATSERISLLLQGKIAVTGPVKDLRDGGDPLVQSFITGEMAYGKTK
ncbi:MAG: ATP-binding cassette domain-containing protein [Bdellovibrionales bacterium]|nr:ATP-binding cassette domain-containing protein [Bdellovibrionales bacterium]